MDRQRSRVMEGFVPHALGSCRLSAVRPPKILEPCEASARQEQLDALNEEARTLRADVQGMVSKVATAVSTDIKQLQGAVTSLSEGLHEVGQAMRRDGLLGDGGLPPSPVPGQINSKEDYYEVFRGMAEGRRTAECRRRRPTSSSTAK